MGFIFTALISYLFWHVWIYLVMSLGQIPFNARDAISSFIMREFLFELSFYETALSIFFLH